MTERTKSAVNCDRPRRDSARFGHFIHRVSRPPSPSFARRAYGPGAGGRCSFLSDRDRVIVRFLCAIHFSRSESRDDYVPCGCLRLVCPVVLVDSRGGDRRLDSGLCCFRPAPLSVRMAALQRSLDRRGDRPLCGFPPGDRGRTARHRGLPRRRVALAGNLFGARWSSGGGCTAPVLHTIHAEGAARSDR